MEGFPEPCGCARWSSCHSTWHTCALVCGQLLLLLPLHFLPAALSLLCGTFSAPQNKGQPLGMAHEAPAHPKPGMRGRERRCGENGKVVQTRLRAGVPAWPVDRGLRGPSGRPRRGPLEWTLLFTLGALGPKPGVHLSGACLHPMWTLPLPFPLLPLIPVSWPLLV